MTNQRTTEILAYLDRRLTIDDEWSVREPGEIRWWSGPLMHRIRVADPTNGSGPPSRRLTAETVVAQQIDPSSTHDLPVTFFNHAAHTSALIVDTEDRTARFVSGIDIPDDDGEMALRLATNAVALQAAFAHESAGMVAEILGGTLAALPHPMSGARVEPDEMLTVIDTLFFPLGQRLSPWSRELDTESGPALGKQLSEHAKSVDVTTSLGMLRLQWIPENPTRVRGSAGTAEAPVRLVVSCLDSHPRFGSGLLLLLHLDHIVRQEELFEVVPRLNQLEQTDPDSPGLLGAWTSDGNLSPTFTTFLPAACHLPGLLPWMASKMIERSSWAIRQISALH